MILLSFIIAAGGSYFLYRNNPLKLTAVYANYALHLLRFLTLFFILFLLLGPLLKFISQKTEKPIVVMALDNSQSIINNKDSAYYKGEFIKELDKLKEKIGEKYDLKILTFGSTQTNNGNLTYTEKLSNISDALLAIQNNYYNLNLSAVILASDGIYNQGNNPLYTASNLKSAIYTIALGDTLQRRDLLIKFVRYNQLVYAGNAFDIQVELKAFYCNNEEVLLSVNENGKSLITQHINISNNSYFASIPVTLAAAQEGLHVYTIRVQKLKNEMNYINNDYQIQVNVIKTKQKIVLLAQSAHPDIAAIRKSLEANPNYEVKFALFENYKNEWMDDAGLFILHQLPGLREEGFNLIAQLAKKNMPCLFIVGRQSGLNQLAQLSALQITGSVENFNEAQGWPLASFNLFQLEEDQLNLLSKFAPLITPYGNYKIPTDAAVLLNQQIGYVKTNNPLLFFTQSKGVHQAYLCGEGYWRWYLQDFMLNGNHTFTETLLSKTIQLVAGKDDKSKFRVSPAKKVFDENEPIQIEAELYNDAYELVNEPDVSITLKNEEEKTYSYTFSKTTKAYQLETGTLPPGTYQYNAQVNGINKYQKKTGRFSVSALQTELLQTKADHQLLFNLASKNGGKLFYPNNMQNVFDELTKNENIKPVIYEQKEIKELMHQKWLFGLIVLFMTVEWFIRKWNGFI
ncbi:MAG: VWA domain-containing protein [Bacteroidia bacterium]|nr:VWA domain-containing protein [Bacteroidia bacterium]